LPQRSGAPRLALVARAVVTLFVSTAGSTGRAMVIIRTGNR
jgi:hypothetical protein